MRVIDDSNDDDVDVPPILPDLRAFLVVRYRRPDEDMTAKDMLPSHIVAETVFAHTVQFNPSGALLFGVLTPVNGERAVMHFTRFINTGQWIDVTEIIVPVIKHRTVQ